MLNGPNKFINYYIEENFRNFEIIKKEGVPLVVINKYIAISVLNPTSIEMSIDIINNLHNKNRLLFLILYNEENLKFLKVVPNSFDIILRSFISNNKILNILPIFIYFDNCEENLVNTLKKLYEYVNKINKDILKSYEELDKRYNIEDKLGFSKFRYTNELRVYFYLIFQKLCEKLDKHKLFRKAIDSLNYIKDIGFKTPEKLFEVYIKYILIFKYHEYYYRNNYKYILEDLVNYATGGSNKPDFYLIFPDKNKIIVIDAKYSLDRRYIDREIKNKQKYLNYVNKIIEDYSAYLPGIELYDREFWFIHINQEWNEEFFNKELNGIVRIVDAFTVLFDELILK